jgi:prepilin-type N-terminal cleavage/methylation domain-containing protein
MRKRTSMTIPANCAAPVGGDSSRRGFSLIELLVVIVIIGILIALILPAIAGVRTRARVAQVASEITQLDNGIAKFKSVYNVDPPSSLYIPPIGTAWKAPDRSKVRAIWPQFDFSSNGGLSIPLPNNQFLKGDIHLNGAECLVFFLSGIPDLSQAVPVVTGFSKDPTTPWQSRGTNREGPLFEFANDRFADVDSDRMLEYRDPLPSQTAPYLYLSSQGRRYTPENDGGKLDDYDVWGGAGNSKDLKKVYLKTVNPLQAHRASGYQIISPGLDGLYGTGGVFLDSETLKNDANRQAEVDNITNFSGGQLAP